jgi:hypothetical protein
MGPKDELFLLIKSMNKNEKGYFRKFSGIHSNKGTGDYQKLFDCIGRMEVYDEAIIKREFKGQKILGHLRTTRHYLKNLIIRALRNYYEDQVPYVGELMSLADTYIMLKKGLLQSADKRITKEKDVVLEEGKFTLALLWLNHQENRMIIGGMAQEQYKNGAPMYEQKQKITAQYLNYAGYLFLKSQIIPATVVTDKARIDEVRKLFRHPLLSSSKMALSTQARTLYAELKVRIGYLQDDPAIGREAVKEALAEYDSSKNRIKTEPFTYFMLNSDLLNLMGRNEASDMAPLIARCRKIITDYPDSLNSQHQSVIETYMYFHEMRMYLFLHKPDAALKSGQALEKHLKEYPYIREEEMGLLLLQAFAHVALKQSDAALECLNQIFNTSFANRNDILPDAYLLNIIVHIELGNYAIIKRQAKIAEHFMVKNLPNPKTDLSLVKELMKAAVAIKAGDNKALHTMASGIMKMLDANRIAHKDYIEDWLEVKLAEA